MLLFIYILITYGLTNIVAKENIFKFFRLFIQKHSKFIYKMIKCPTCLGFWVGLILFLFIKPFDLTILDPILAGFLTSGVCNIIESLKNNFELDE